jgi:ElaA protein
MPECSVTGRSWSELTTTDLYSFLKLRTDVFYLEQKVDEEELDGRDLEPETRHFWIADDRGTAAYLRVIADAEPEYRDARRLIGRVVVRADRRGEGLAQLLITEVIARFGHEAMLLHAQEYVAPLYAKFGFEAFGDSYQEAGIAHLSMYRPATAGAAGADSA